MVIVDTAGRLGIDTEMMQQATDIRAAVDPQEVLFVVDAMVGQDAVNTAEAFRDGVGFTGVVLTKLDGDARGGAALSVREVTGQPIMFASNGEKLEDFDVFHPDRMASRILGMGDMLTLIEQAQQHFDEAEAEKMAAKLAAGNQFTLEDFLDQLMAIRKMGPIGNLLGMLPGMGQMKDAISADRRQGPRPHGRDHPLDDAGRAREPEDDQRLAPAAHRERFGREGQRGQPARRPVLRGPQDDGPARRHGHARACARRSRRPSRPRTSARRTGQGQEGRPRPDAAADARRL